MVNPSWQSFKKQKEIEIDNQIEQIPQNSRPTEEFEEEIPGETNDTQTPEPEKQQWGNFKTPLTYQGEIDEKEEESNFGYLIRNITMNASRLGEQLLGRAGNVEKMGKDILTNYPQVGGLFSLALSELMGPERWERIIKGRPGEQQMLATSEQLKDLSQKATGNYTKPRTPGEERFQGYIEDIGATASGGVSASARNIAINNIGIPVAANLAKDTIKDLGFGEDKATIAKLGIWTTLSLLNNVNAPRYASDLMNRGRTGVPDTLNIDVPRLERRLQTVANDPNLLHADPRTSLARQEIANIQRDLANGQVSVRSLMTTYDGVNAAKRDAGLFALNRGDQRFARNAIDRVRNAVRDEIVDAGALFPEAINNWRSGIQAWSVIHQSNALTNWISSISKGPHAKILSGPAAALFGITSYGGIKSPLIAGPFTAAVPAAYKGYQTAYRVWNDQNLSRYYWTTIRNAQQENLPAFINSYNKLNKSLEKSESVKKKSKAKKN